MNAARHPNPWLVALGLLLLLLVLAITGCQSLRHLRWPYHEPAVRSGPVS
ncbi:hypothetical protein [Caulobacter zeae]|nr:hypothetical protein [Caulobacter zeae]